MKNLIKEKRTEKNITQEEMAKKIDVSLSHYRNIERERNIPNVEIAIKIAKILNTTVENIFIVE